MGRKTRTPQDVREDLRRRGISVAGWARKHRLPEQTVRDLLSGKARGHRGLAHRAAVLLGLKDGLIDDHSHAEAASGASA